MPLNTFAKAKAPTKIAAARRGKVAEGKVRDYLRALEDSTMQFTFNRIGDAGAAGGAFAAQSGDYQAFGWGKNWLIEVKELQHAYRLPHASFGAEQVARMQKRALAGTVPVVLIYHRNEKVWRCPPFATFATRVGGSWDFRNLETSTLAEIMEAIFES